MDSPLRERHIAYISLWLFALAFGWIEGCVVVYLRDVYLRDVASQGADVGLQITAVALPFRVVRLELVREACTLVVLAAVAALSARRLAGRWGAFLVGFGVWDLMYYVTLWIALGWPDSLSTWDILFLIPVPWVAPVWAPVLVATLFIVIGSYLFLTEQRERIYGWVDSGMILAAAVIVVGSFLVESGAAVEHRVPSNFPVWLYAAGVALGAGWVIHVERAAPKRSRRMS